MIFGALESPPFKRRKTFQKNNNRGPKNNNKFTTKKKFAKLKIETRQEGRSRVKTFMINLVTTIGFTCLRRFFVNFLIYREKTNEQEQIVLKEGNGKVMM